MKSAALFQVPSSSQLDRYRLEGDAPTDDFITRLMQLGGAHLIPEIMQSLNTNNFIYLSSCDQEQADLIKNYISDSSVLPKWVNAQLLEHGQKVFQTHTPSIFMLLNMSALPICYSCCNGSKVLYETGKLLSQKQIQTTKRRLMDTAQMVIDVFGNKALQIDGPGVRSAQRVRLIHALTRHHLNTKTDWDDARYGVPINQEDMAGTLMSFSTVTLAGLKKLDIKLSEQEIAGYMHYWKVIGHLMGIEEKLMPDRYEDGFALASAILKHQSAPSEESAELTATHLQFLNSMLPFRSSSNVLKYLINHFIHEFSISSGIDLCQCIGISPDNQFSRVPIKITFGLLNRYILVSKGKITSRVLAPLNTLFLQQIINLLKIDYSAKFLKR